MEAYQDPQVFGPYRLHAAIAKGGMAEVFLGTTQQKEFHGQFLAIKKLLPHLNTNKPFINLLIHEAKIGVLLNHPGIVSVFDLGSYRTDFFLAMEYVHGKSLDRLLERIKEGTAPKIPLEVSVYIGLEVLRALAFAHQLKDAKGRDLNIIHRDVSPGNILLGYRGEVKLTDFGIATAEHRLQPGFTQTALGKLAYMAPEQAVNDPVVKASDLYSLAVVIYEMLTGQLPFHAESASALYKKIVDGRVTDMRITGPALSPGLREVITRCLNRSAAKRYQSAPELFSAIQKHFQEESEVDFSSRTIRQYYKKKLAEYLRLVFEKDIIEELGVIQNALKMNTADNEFKITAPQDLKRVQDFQDDGAEGGVSEHTMIAQDLTNEATRNYPLTQDERDKILAGIPPEEVLQGTPRPTATLASNMPLTDPHFRGAGYDLATIPEYDLVTEDSSLRRISVKDKLKLSALNKEEKETLNQQIPDIEIDSEQSLDAFEQSTFSGFPDAIDTESTRAMDRSEIITDFGKIKSRITGGGDLEESPPAKTAKPENKAESAVFNAPTNIKGGMDAPTPIKNRSSRVSEAYQVPTKKSEVARTTAPRRSHKPLAVVFLILIILAGGFVYLQRSMSIATFSKLSDAPHMLPTQTVSLILIKDDVPETANAFLGSLTDKNNPQSLLQVESFFNHEFKRYSSDSKPVLDLQISNYSVISRGLTKRFDAPSLIASSKIFQFFDEAGLKKSTTHPTIYVYFYPFDPAATNNPTFPEEFKGEHIPKAGLVFAPAYPSERIKILENIAREIAFIYGATDKRDPSTNMPTVPGGLANPQERPLYPQTKAELMAKDVPLNVLQKRSISDFNDLVIGAETAYEFGWIDSSKRKILLRSN